MRVIVPNMGAYKELYEYTNTELRGSGDMICIFRKYFALNPDTLAEEEIDEPVALAKLHFLRFMTPRLRMDAMDLNGVDFHWRDVNACSEHTLDAVKAHLRQEDEIHLYLRHVAIECRKDFTWK